MSERLTKLDRSVTYGDLSVGDVIEVQIDAPMFPQIDGDWEKREVVAINIGREIIVRFRDPSDGEEYDIDVRSPKELRRRMRRPLTPEDVAAVEVRDYEWRVVPYRRAGDALVEGEPVKVYGLSDAKRVVERHAREAERLRWDVPSGRIERRPRRAWEDVDA